MKPAFILTILTLVTPLLYADGQQKDTPSPPGDFCVVLRRSTTADHFITGKEFYYVSGKYPPGFKFRTNLRGRHVRKLVELGGRFVVLEPKYTTEDLGKAELECATKPPSPPEQPAEKDETQPTDPGEQSDSAICLVRVNSDPEAADVELDGKFVGNTPTLLRLKPGDYTITVRKTGYDAWERTLTALAGNELPLFAELTKQE